MVDDLLLATVEDVLGIMRSDLRYSELIDCTVENRLVFEMPNKPELLVTAIDLVMQMAAGMQLLTGQERYRVAQALQQATSNALFRGNLELSRKVLPQASIIECSSDSLPDVVRQRLSSKPFGVRKIHFDARLMRDLIRVVVKDDGPGFDVRTVEAIQHENEGAAAFAGDVGRGLTLIHRFIDRVSFNTAGNEITMVKHCGDGHGPT
jgi:hypothetical protein